jgi:hypothetical protein
MVYHKKVYHGKGVVRANLFLFPREQTCETNFRQRKRGKQPVVNLLAKGSEKQQMIPETTGFSCETECKQPEREACRKIRPRYPSSKRTKIIMRFWLRLVEKLL